MDLGRRITPKTQREILISQQELYVPPPGSPGFTPTGNPNLADNPGRSGQISFKGDTTKPFSIGIQDIDEAVFYYFKNVIKPFVIHNGERLEVPIIYGSPEKWKSFQKDGYYRDLNGRIMAPLIMFKKNNIEKVRNLTNKLDANNANNIAIYGERYSRQNEYSKFNILNNVKPEKTTTSKLAIGKRVLLLKAILTFPAIVQFVKTPSTIAIAYVPNVSVCIGKLGATVTSKAGYVNNPELSQT